jgi:hypothetical protein
LDEVPEWLIKTIEGGRRYRDSSQIANEMMHVNDRPELTQKDREKELKRLARLAGHVFEFVGRLGVPRRPRGKQQPHVQGDSYGY